MRSVKTRVDGERLGGLVGRVMLIGLDRTWETIGLDGSPLKLMQELDRMLEDDMTHVFYVNDAECPDAEFNCELYAGTETFNVCYHSDCYRHTSDRQSTQSVEAYGTVSLLGADWLSFVPGDAKKQRSFIEPAVTNGVKFELSSKTPNSLVLRPRYASFNKDWASFLTHAEWTLTVPLRGWRTEEWLQRTFKCRALVYADTSAAFKVFTSAVTEALSQIELRKRTNLPNEDRIALEKLQYSYRSILDRLPHLQPQPKKQELELMRQLREELDDLDVLYIKLRKKIAHRPVKYGKFGIEQPTHMRSTLNAMLHVARTLEVSAGHSLEGQLYAKIKRCIYRIDASLFKLVKEHVDGSDERASCIRRARDAVADMLREVTSQLDSTKLFGVTPEGSVFVTASVLEHIGVLSDTQWKAVYPDLAALYKVSSEIRQRLVERYMLKFATMREFYCPCLGD